MTCCLTLLVLAACGLWRPVSAQTPVYDSRAEVTFYARGTVDAVLDTLVAELNTRECLDVRRGRDVTGAAALSLTDPCPGRVDVATVQIVDAGDGTVRGTVREAYAVSSTTRILATFPSGALVRLGVPVYVVPVAEHGQPPCSTPETWRAELDAPVVAVPPPDTTVVETPPGIVGGLDAFVRSVRYPDAARDAGAQGRTYVRFIVGETGAVTCAELPLSLHPALDAEALRAVRAARFTPGTQDGRPVSVRMTLPIVFRLR